MMSASRAPQPTQEAERDTDAEVDDEARAAREQQAAGVAEELVLVELEAQVEQQEDQAEDRDELDVRRLEPAGDQVHVRAREQPDQHVDRDRRQPDELAEAPQDVGDDEEDAEDEKLAAHRSVPGMRVDGAFRFDLTRAIEGERLRHLLGRASGDEGVAGEHLEVFVGCRVGGFAAHDRDDRHADHADRAEVAERLAGDVVVVVDVEPVDRETRESSRGW